MSNLFQFPAGSSSPPSTPDRNSRGRSNLFLGKEPSTTPAGPPPSSAGSFTPAGAPSASYLGSSIGRGTTASKPPTFADHKSAGSPKNLFAPKRNANLGRSVRGSTARQPSRLSKQVAMDDEDEDEDEEEEEEEDAGPANAGGTFRVSFDDTFDDDELDAEGEEDDEAEEYHLPRRATRQEEEEDEGDMWLNMPPAQTNIPAYDPDVSDLMMLNTPAAQRVEREAEEIFRATAMQSRARREEHKFASLAKDIYGQMGFADVEERPEIILSTEAFIETLYDDGVGASEDPEKLDNTLATVAGELATLWKSYADSLPRSDAEHPAEIGPSPHAPPFEKAYYLANLALQIRHTRYDSEDGPARIEPLPETLFRWLNDYHDLYPTQTQEVLSYRPSPACHSLYWQTLFISILRGRVDEALPLLREAGFGHVRRGQRGGYAYTGQSLDNVQIAVQETCAMLESCPALDGDWEIGNSAWTLFRVRAQGAMENLRRFAENKDDAMGESFSGSMASRRSMAGMARKAESKVPWEIYENLNIIFEIVLGSQAAILETAQDWCEATIGLFGWWDERRATDDKEPPSFSRSQALALPSRPADSESFLDRLARSFHSAVQSDFHFNSMNPVEVGIACIFEDNTNGLIGIIRGLSLPVASSLAEIAALGKWLPPHQRSAFEMADLDMEDLEVLGMGSGAPDEVDGIKDTTLVQYAEELADMDTFSYLKDKDGVTRDGWELAIQVLGRMDSPEKSEEMVGKLIENLLQNLQLDSNVTVEKIWRLMTDLGMVPFAEKASEVREPSVSYSLPPSGCILTDSLDVRRYPRSRFAPIW